VSAANTELASASSQLANARQAQASYASAYASILKLGKAVPAQDEVPALIYQLAQASHRRGVNFASIVAGTGSAPAAGASAASPASAGAGAAATSSAAAGFSQLPFTFTFEGTFADLYRLFSQLNAATVRTASGGLQVSGRLLTIQSAKLAPVPSSGTKPSGRLTGTVTATAYVLGGGQSVAGGATASSPNGASTPASTPASGSSPAAPAVARVTP